MNKNGILLEVLQVLSDLDLHIFKAYITSDGGWFMDGKIKIKMMPPSPVVISAAAHLVQRPMTILLDAVFHVVDKQGQKITDDKTIKYIEKVSELLQYLFSTEFLT
jgi:hypothetical protein